MHMHVNVEAVNLREVASTQGNEPLRTLRLGDSVELLGAGPAGWHHVRAEVNGAMRDGFCVADMVFTKANWTPPRQPTLRDTASAGREALVAAAVEQWHLFDRGTGLEHEEPFSTYIASMWKALGEPYTGKDTDHYWSAAAISHMVRRAALLTPRYKNFRESTGHAKYMWHSIREAANADPASVFWGLRLGQAKPQVGDIIGSWRETPFTFDQYLKATKNPEMPSHCDIVVSVGPGLCLAIGGNVRNSVYATGYELDNDGFLTLNRRFDKATKKLVGEAIVLMVNRADVP